jgi:hypothetical protein
MPEITQISQNVHEVAFDNIRAGWEQWILLSSDRHWDHPHSDRRIQKRHLEQAKERGAGILDFGDFFCVMQSQDDPRAAKSAIRLEDQVDDYLDKVVNDAAEDLAKYPWWVIAKGNHDTKILKRKHTDLIARFTERMRALKGGNIKAGPPFAGGFSGWVVFRFKVRGTVSHALRLWYHHGYGGDSPVTKGTIQSNRMAVYLPDANIVCSGHSHNEWQLPITRLRINQSGTLYKDDQLHLKIPSYKDEYQDGQGGWEIERGAPPKPKGAMWLRFWVDSQDGQRPIKYEATRAQ